MTDADAEISQREIRADQREIDAEIREGQADEREQLADERNNRVHARQGPGRRARSVDGRPRNAQADLRDRRAASDRRSLTPCLAASIRNHRPTGRGASVYRTSIRFGYISECPSAELVS
jgi:hypothetical protein